MRARDLLLSLTAIALVACGSDPGVVSPTAPVGPPPFVGPSGTVEPTADGAPTASSSQEVAPPPVSPEPVTFYRAKDLDSNDWVSHNFKLQARYTRVIAVYSGSAPPTKVTVPRLDLNAYPGGEPNDVLDVTIAVKTLEEAANQAKGGDLVVVLAGRYKGFRIGDKPDAGDGRYIHFRALGAPGDVIIDSPCPQDPNWMILLEGAHHVIVQGFNIAGSNTPGTKEPRGPNAGILISGNFLHTSRLAHNIAILGNYSHDHKVWGIHSVDSHTVLVQDNLFANSVREHSAYFSDGSDDYVIRRNVFFGSNASGLQVNVDPLASLEKLAKHPVVDAPPMQPTREWALGVLKTAADRFGANAFPDGRGFNFIIESNVINGNGRGGGAAINLAGVRESTVQNNLVYGNYSSGIAEWDNNNPFDAAQVKPGPQTAAEVTGAEVLPIFGCFKNLLRNNTILMGVKGRPALRVGNGSWGTRAYNNVLVNDEMPSIEVDNTSIWLFDASANVLDRVNYEGPAMALRSLAVSLPDNGRSVVGVNRTALASHFVKPGEEPWIIFDGNWWRLNPRRPDFHPRASGTLLSGKGDLHHQPKLDLDGRKRVKADIGAYAAVLP